MDYGLRKICARFPILGMCIRTDLSGQHRLGAYDGRVVEQCDDKGMLTNLRARLANQPFPERIELLCGDTNDLDVEHAENLRGLPNVCVVTWRAIA